MKLEEYSKLQLIYAVYDALTYIPHEMMFGCTCWKGEVQEYFFDRIRSILEILTALILIKGYINWLMILKGSILMKLNSYIAIMHCSRN